MYSLFHTLYTQFFKKFSFFLNFRKGAKAGLMSALLVSLLFSFSGCSDSSEDLGESDEHDEEVYAWIWAYDKDNSTIRAYKFTEMTGDETAALTANAKAHAAMHIMTSGGPDSDTPAIWMGGGTDETDSGIYSFTTGFYGHIDHAHMEQEPKSHLTISSDLNKPTHMGKSPDGSIVAFANDGSKMITVVNTKNGDSENINIDPYVHSAALLSNSFLIATHKGDGDEGTGADVKIFSISYDSDSEEWTHSDIWSHDDLCTFIHGDAYYDGNDTAFIACNEGIYALPLANLPTAPTETLITYPDGIYRTNFLFHNGDNYIAVGLHKPEDKDDDDEFTSDSLLLLNMKELKTEKLTIPDSTLIYKNEFGNFAISEDGKAIVYADTNLPVVYHINIDPNSSDYKKVTTLDALEANASVAISYSGGHIWTLTGTATKTVSHIHVEDGNTEGTFTVDSDTDWIYATTSDPDLDIVLD